MTSKEALQHIVNVISNDTYYMDLLEEEIEVINEDLEILVMAKEVNMERIKFIRSQFIELKALIKEMQQSDFHVMLNYNYGEFMGIYNTLDKLLTQNDGTSLYAQMSVRKELESLRIDCVNAYKYTLSQLKGIRADND